MGGVFLCILFLFYLFSTLHADLIASSQITNCVLDGSSEDTILNCQKKFVVSLSVDNGQNKTEAVQFTISSATDGNTTLQFVNPWTITLSKSPVAIYYPISYLQTVNADPSEAVIYTRDWIVVSSCQSGAYSDNPTCGWYKDSNGNNIPDSQGFCCSCNLAEYLGISDDQTRAGLTCSFFSGSSSSAHCLRFDDNGWYDIFQIANAQDMYTIDIDISQGGGTNTTVTLSPSTTISSSSSVIARLLGDFSPFQQLPVYSTKYLAVPSSGNPRETDGMDTWMMIDTDLFDLSGTVCNKIGVSFAGFNSEASHCKLLVNSCLGYQIEDYYQSDLQLQKANRIGNYFLSFFGGLYYAETYTSSLTNRFLAFDLTGLQSSVITLTFSADDIRFVTNESPGQIVSAYVEEFEALSKDGRMHVVVVNNGTINAQYEITVTQCSTGIATIQAQEPTLVPRKQTEFIFNIQSENALQKSYQCKVSLLDSQAVLLDYRIVYFNTSATNFQTTAQGGDTSGDSGDDLKSDKHSSCSQACSAFYDIICFLSHKCWKNVFSFLGTIIGIAAGLFILYKLKQHFGMCGLCSKICCGCCGSSSNDKKKKKKKKAKKEKLKREKSVKMKKMKKEKSTKHREETRGKPSDYEKTRGNSSDYSSDSSYTYSSGSEGSYSSYTSGSDYDSSSSEYELEEGRRRRGAMGLSSSEMSLSAQRHTPVYLCFSGAKNTPLYKPGAQFCLIGEIEKTKNNFEFNLEAYPSQTKYLQVSTQRYARLQTPRPIDVELFRMPLNDGQVRKSLTTNPPAMYTCINKPYATKKAKNKK
uniref:Generative cell specific-1 n=1 Tax=Physarum polycephalum TaxID=5791 RepID=Q2PGG5_PHYPO|nr:generative cell specific-1 [Physarum polycephalum]